jgi:hypothetical protein
VTDVKESAAGAAGSEEPAEPVVSKAEIAAGVQSAFAMCATCGHMQGNHSTDGEPGACTEVWKTGPEKAPIEHTCKCVEYWPYRRQKEDGLSVIEHTMAFSGGQEIILDRRVPTEFWDGLMQGARLKLTVWAQVAGKNYKPKREKGMLIGLTEVRGLTVEYVDYEGAMDG